MNKLNLKKRKISKPALILIIGIIIIAIPCFIFGGILISSALQSGTPVIGSRFDNDLETKISNDDVTKIKDSLENLAGVESVTVDGTTTGQCIVLLDVVDSYSEEEASKVADDAYKKVLEVLPVGTYFTATDTNKNYDLSIHVYNRLEKGDDEASWSYVILTKNSMMELPDTQVVSTPLDEHLAKELRGELEEAELQEDDSAGTSEESGD